MRKGDYAELKMEKTLCRGDAPDGKVHGCTVLKYDEKQECIYFQLQQSSELTGFSLDVVYLCEIHTEEEVLRCTGRVKERYCGKAGKTLRFQIENGFYKITIKSLTNK